VLLAAFPAEAVSDPELAPVLTADRLTRGSLDELAACVAYAERRFAAVPDDRRLRFDVMLGTLVTRPSSRCWSWRLTDPSPSLGWRRAEQARHYPSQVSGPSFAGRST
jgi:hypothetical protein